MFLEIPAMNGINFSVVTSDESEVQKKQKGILRRNICDICGKGYTRPKHLSTHISSVHEGHKPFLCKSCPSTFGQKSHLTSHVKVVHKGKKPYGCDICRETFAEKRTLTNHKARHLGGDRPKVKCSICARTYFNQKSLDGHQKKKSILNFFRAGFCTLYLLHLL